MSEIGVDIGGTFTDAVLIGPTGILHHVKVPSTPSDPIVGVRTAVERSLALANQQPSDVTRFAHGSTVALNAFLERKGAVTGILMTDGFEDTLEIGRQKRSRLYDLFLEPETPIFLSPRRRRIGIPERIAANGEIVKPLDEEAVRRGVRDLVDCHGVTAIAVCYLFSFCNTVHEQRTRQIISDEAPGVHISLSCEVNPAFREYERSVLTVLDAYLRGAVGDYVRRLQDTLADMGIHAKLQVMQSRGGLTGEGSVARRPVALLFSGLAAGVVGSRFVAERAGCVDTISLDMGGTSCDIALIRTGRPIVANQGRLERLPIRLQMIDINTIGAGGGSIAWLDEAGGLRVGPQSAGAVPGPACYGRGGTSPTVTDASLVLGYLNPETFSGGQQHLDVEAAIAAIKPIAHRLNRDVAEVAAGIHTIVNAKMADEVRRVSVQRGHDPRGFALLPLGGAGPVHAGAIGPQLGMSRFIVPASPGVLSAFGLLVADFEHDNVETFLHPARSTDDGAVEAVLARLSARGTETMATDGIDPRRVEIRRFADMRYVGQSYELGVALPPLGHDLVKQAVQTFHSAHSERYGHCDESAAVEFVNLRTVHVHPASQIELAPATGRSASWAAPIKKRPAYFAGLGGFVDTPVYERRGLVVDQVLVGPAIVEQPDSTLVLYPGQQGRLDAAGNVVVEVRPNGGAA